MYKSSYPGGLKLPELSSVDKTVYAALLGVTCLGSAGAVTAFLLLWQKLPLTDPAVAGFANSMGILGMVIAGLLMALVIGQLFRARIREYPIFGRTDISYGSEAYTPIYPLLMPTGNAPEEIKRTVREGRQSACFLLAGVILAVFVFAVSMLSGNLLDMDGGVRILWGPGWELESYEPEEVDEVTVVFHRPSGSPRSYSPRKAKITLKYRMEDDRLYEFEVNSFRRDSGLTQVELLEQILSRYPGAQIRFQGEQLLSQVVRDQGYSQTDQRILMELIGRM